MDRTALEELLSAQSGVVSRRQRATASDRGLQFRDVSYEEFAVVVELDGRLFHDSVGQRDLDLDRDLDDAVDGRRSVRLGWGQVFDRQCRTASKVGLLLQRRGWPGSLRRCGPECTIAPQPG